MKQSMKALQKSAHLGGGSATYLEEMYEAYLNNPNSIEPKWRDYFENLPQQDATGSIEVAHSPVRAYFLELAKQKKAATAAARPASAEHEQKQIRVLQLINAYRFRGHQKATLEPLGLVDEPAQIPELTLAHHELSNNDLDIVFSTGSFAADKREMTLRELYKALNDTYCGSIGVEYMHITETKEKRWLQQKLERSFANPELSLESKKRILEKLTAAEGLEKYLHTKYVGQKRFSLEGGESLIPLLDELICRSAKQGCRELVIGMAHRGRLNVLVNTLGKSPALLFDEFEGRHTHVEHYGKHSGDVKYHMGFSSDVSIDDNPVHIALAFNPSHLEIVSPVVTGSVRARQQRREDRDKKQVIPIQIHGDAAFAGQGVVMETLNMSQARGFSVGGTVHIIVNNQVGFTTSNPLDARSTLYCTDVAKMVQSPIFHVNGDDPEAVNFVTQIALDYRQTFKKDVIIDLVCYRRHGHNEADEPSATQPMMYKKIKQHPTTRKIYAEKLIGEGSISAEDEKSVIQQNRARLEAGESIVQELVEDVQHPFALDWKPFVGAEWTEEVITDTSVALEKIRDIADNMEVMPDAFDPHPRVKKIMGDRHKMSAGALAMDWGYAETMAYATLLEQGYAVRLVGQDSGRGTFFHRHAVLHNQIDGDTYLPLQHVADPQPQFLVIDSLLSEEAVLAYEYGYATTDPKTLVIWEAQFGDFANGAQVVIDQFISSGEQKWGRLCGLVMLLPHGYEGQGPEHSSARLERYLQLCAQHNIQVCAPTTPAQVYHMLRRQMLMPARKPLVVMTPKSLLRHKLAVSPLEDLSKGHFHTVIPEIDDPRNGGPDKGGVKADKVKRVILCSGKVYYDLLESRRAQGIEDIAILRIEQLYPFPEGQLTEELKKYPGVKDVIWCQEEPMNQGAWYCSQHHMRNAILEGQTLRYVGRAASASPAVGYHYVHVEQQKALVAEALES